MLERKSICLEGIDYSGKTSLAQKLASSLPNFSCGERNVPVLREKERQVHNNPNHMARVQFFLEEISLRSEYIVNSLKQNNLILDRYVLSVFAYHNVLLGRKLEGEFFPANIYTPDITILITISPEELKRRMKLKPPEHIYDSDTQFLMAVQNEFSKLASWYPNVVKIDTSGRTVLESYKLVLEEIRHRAPYILGTYIS